MNTSARLLRINIGEQKKFYIPLSIYCGVSNNTIQNSGAYAIKSNEHLINNYINPLSGLLNISFDDYKVIVGKEKISKLGTVYQIGERVLYGIKEDTTTKIPTYSVKNFLNFFCNVGFLFHTNAWEQDRESNVGVFWLTVRGHFTKSSLSQIRQFLPTIETNGIYYGYSFGFGVNITNAVDLKVIYYKYLKKPEIEYSQPMYQFSLNYISK